MIRYSDLAKLKTAKAIAADAGLFIVEKPDAYLLYRERKDARNEYLGRRASVDGLLSFVKKVANFK